MKTLDDLDHLDIEDSQGKDSSSLASSKLKASTNKVWETMHIKEIILR